MGEVSNAFVVILYIFFPFVNKDSINVQKRIIFLTLADFMI